MPRPSVQSLPFPAVAALALVISGVVSAGAVTLFEAVRPGVSIPSCTPTQTDALGPYYVAGAPVRTVTGSGELTITGTVRSWPSCEPVPGAKLEFWQADASGKYSDEQRATLYAGKDGSFTYRSDFPGKYEERPIHLHVKVSATGLRELVTQDYPSLEPRDVRIEGDLVAVAEGATPPAGYDVAAPANPRR